jgi:hypothetical protein
VRRDVAPRRPGRRPGGVPRPPGAGHGRERRRLRRDRLVTHELGGQPVDIDRGRHVTGEHVYEVGGVVAEPGGAGGPRGAQLRLGGAAVLGGPGGERCDLGRLRGGLAAFGQPGDDGLPPAGEAVDQRPRGPGDVGVAVDHRLPGDPEPAGELMAEVGLVEHPGGLGVQEDPPRLQRPPHAIVRRADEVRDEHVGVQQRIAGTGGAVPEPGRDQPVHLDPFGPARPATGPGGFPLEVADRCRDRGVVCRHDLVGHVRVAEPPQQRHRLRGAEGQVESRHLPGRMCCQPLAGLRVVAGQHPPQRLAGDLTVEPDQLEAAAEPPSRRLPSADVVVLRAGWCRSIMACLHVGWCRSMT